MEDFPLKELHNKILNINRLLVERFGEPHRKLREPLKELVLTILSQHTSDANALRTFSNIEHFFNKQESITDLSSMPQEQLAALIKTGGMSNIKALRIQSALKEIYDRESRFSIARLQNMILSDAYEYLTTLPGVGVKTAACVLLFSWQRPAFPVDTHVYRITKRLSLIQPGMDAPRAQAWMEQITPAANIFTLHMSLVTLGRQICRARNSLCDDCPLQKVCPSRLLPAETANN